MYELATLSTSVPPRQLRSARRRAAGRPAQRGDRGDSGAGDAPRVGRGRIAPTSLMAPRGSIIANIIPLPRKSAA
jgi:hypothetical protein